jgi:hypothetical protein
MLAARITLSLSVSSARSLPKSAGEGASTSILGGRGVRYNELKLFTFLGRLTLCP